MKENDKPRPYANLSINGCPFHVWRGISEPAKAYCNDQYWVRIKELLDKERELETLRIALMDRSVGNTITPQVTPEQEEQPVKKRYIGSDRK